MTATPLQAPSRGGSRSQALRQATAALHAEVDQAVMAIQPFRQRDSYARFLVVQYRFHQLTAAFFRDPMLNLWFPGLAGRERLANVEQDCRDLGLDPARYRETPIPAPQDAQQRAAAVGWLYVNEGSNLGAAFLYKHAQQLGLSGEHGARHLAPHANGRAPHWRQFTAQIDAAPLEAGHEPHVVDGARGAFGHVIQLARSMATG